MTGVRWFLAGYYIGEFHGADPGRFLNELTKSNVPFWNIVWVNALTVQFCFPKKRNRQVECAADRSMGTYRMISLEGFVKFAEKIISRPVLLIVCALCFFLICFIQQFVLTYEVIGNTSVPDERILRALREYDIGFGTFGASIHPQQIKDQILNQLPELEWITVTQSGCLGTVVVRERPETPNTLIRRGFSNVVASRAGIITKQSVFAGQAQHQVGDVVKEGEILISGVVDLDRIYIFRPANGEVFARTWRKQQIAVPLTYEKKTKLSKQGSCLWINIGKNRIKIFGNSGISMVSCVKMNTMKKLCLPGGAELPVSLEIEHFWQYTPQTAQLPAGDAKAIGTDYLLRHTEKSMMAGEILKQSFALQKTGNCYLICGNLECHEMIAKTVPGGWKNEDRP